MDLDVSTLAAFAQDYQRVRAENATLRADLEEARAFTLRGTDTLGTPLASPEEEFLQLPSGEYRYPTPAETVERAVWRRVEFLHYLKRNGIEASNVRTSLVIDWFKRWFLHESDGWQRRKNAGYTLDEIQTLSVHHIIPQEIGGRHSVYNYHILPRAVNSHLGWQLGRLASLWVGEENLRVALQYAQFVRDRTHTNDTNFNPEALPCPRRVSTKRPAEAPPVVVLPNKQPRATEERMVEFDDQEGSTRAVPHRMEKTTPLFFSSDKFLRSERTVRYNPAGMVDVRDVVRTFTDTEGAVRSETHRLLRFLANRDVQTISWEGSSRSHSVVHARHLFHLLKESKSRGLLKRRTADVVFEILRVVSAPPPAESQP